MFSKQESIEDLILKPCSETDLETIHDEIYFISQEDTDKIQSFIPQMEVNTYQEWCHYVISKNITVDLIDSIVSTGQATLALPWAFDKELISSHCVQLGICNFLRFSSPLGAVYVYQENFTIEGLYFVDLRLAIALRGQLSFKRNLKNFLLKINKHSDHYKSYFSAPAIFGGVKLEHQSPYHFYYFKVHSLFNLFNLYKSKNLSLEIVTSPEGAFLDLLNPFSDIIKGQSYIREFVQTKEKIIPFECLNHCFYVVVGDQKSLVYTHKEAKDYLLPLDTCVRYFAIESNPEIAQIASNNKKNGSFILWLGITTGKRKWLEEVEGYALLILKLSEIHKHITVIFDGWTARHTLNGEQVNHPGYAEDEKIKSEIITRCHDIKNVHFYSVIGRCAEDKIAVASQVDFFVSNHATGSIWVSRVAQCTGITHISNAARQSAISQHLHHNSDLIPTNLTSDVNDLEEEDLFKVSYSIKPHDFLCFCLHKLYKNELIKTKKTENISIYHFIENKINLGEKTPNILYQLARAFEDKGDLSTALSLIENALRLRPEGPVLKAKAEEYKHILNEKTK